MNNKSDFLSDQNYEIPNVETAHISDTIELPSSNQVEDYPLASYSVVRNMTPLYTLILFIALFFSPQPLLQAPP